MFNLSEVCSEVLSVFKAYGEAADDVAAWHAPSECYALVYRGFERNLSDVLDEAGLAPHVFYQMVADRTTEKFAYDMFGQVLGLHQTQWDYPIRVFGT